MVFIDNLFYMSKGFFGFWAYVVVFFAVLIESFPFIGAFVPGGIIGVLACGFLARLGYFSLWKIVLVLIAGSVCIDTFGYWFGRSRTRGFLHRRSGILFVKRKTIEKVIRIVHGHAGKSLIFGRMNPITRATAPFIVGNERVPFLKFLFYSIIGSILWVICFTFLGYILGSSHEAVLVAERYILWISLSLIGIFYGNWLVSIFREYFGKKIRGRK